MVMSNTARPILKIEDFSKSPGGRERSDGRFSGEEYREEVIAPALKKYHDIAVDLRGVRVIIPSFVDEAFGPYIEKWGAEEFNRRIELLYRPGSTLEDIVRETIRLRNSKR